MKRKTRAWIIAAAAVVFVVLCIGLARMIVIRRPFPETRGTVQVQGLDEPVEIVRDSDGVPHIYADTIDDMFFAQGYVHAQDRFWQMDFYRRAGAGRLSELFGEATLGIDKYLRTMGFRAIAEEEFPQLQPNTRRAIEAYSSGINAYIQNHKPARLGIQYALLELRGVEVAVEPWTPIHTLFWYKLMAEQMSGGSERELHMLEVIRAVGIDLAQDFFPPYREDVMPYAISDDEFAPQASTLAGRPFQEKAFPEKAFNLTDEHIASLTRCSTELVGGYDAHPLRLLGVGTGMGSNAWAISGSRTESGKPLFANDVHLRMTIPSIFYEIGMHCKTGGGPSGNEPLNLRGHSVPGSFGIQLGQNDRITWGYTIMSLDVQDLYIERINPYNPNQYEVNGAWVDMDLRVEEIHVHDWDEPYRLLVRNTRHGPVVTDVGDTAQQNSFNVIPEKNFPDNLEMTALSLRFTALQPQKMPDMVLGLNMARNFDEFREALSDMSVPIFNVAYADVDGNIGYVAPGLMPIRKRGNGGVPVPGWTDDYEWTGYVPYEAMPYVLNPEKGYVITANNPPVSSRYPYDIVVDYDYGYRAQRITQMIEDADTKLTLDHMKRMQADTLNTSAMEILPFLRTLSFEEDEIENALQMLYEWDGRMDMESGPALLYGYFWVALVESIFQDELPDRLWNRSGGVVGADSAIPSKVYDLLNAPSNRWWDDVTTLDLVETRDDILARSFEKGYRRCVKSHGEERDTWRWGDVHTATFEDQTFGRSGIGLIENIFNRGPVATSGGFHQVNRSDFSLDQPFDVYHIAVCRHVLDLSDLSESYTIVSSGQSGHPGHGHYDDFIDRWRFVEYHPVRWERDEVEEDSRGKLTLKPE